MSACWVDAVGDGAAGRCDGVWDESRDGVSAASPISAGRLGRRCGIARRSPSTIRIGCRLRRRRRSWRCGGRPGGGRSRCQRRWAGRRRRSGGCLRGTAARGRRGCRGRRRIGTSTPRLGELVHLDIKKLGRFWQVGKRVLQDGVRRSGGAGWQYAHVAVDDHSRHAIVAAAPIRDAASTAPPSRPR